ncbi:MAG: hypothetical protein V4681_03540 [Patescibacteria group bacterium]
MNTNLKIVGPYSYANPELDGLRDRVGGTFARFLYRTNLMKVSPAIPCAILFEVYARDGSVLAGVARTNMEADELALVDSYTWADLFAKGTTHPFFDQRLRDVETQALPTGSTADSLLERVCGAFMALSALGASDIEKIPMSILLAAGILPSMRSEEIAALIGPLAGHFARDPFLTEPFVDA